MRINFVVASESLSTSKCSKHEIPCTHGKQIQIGFKALPFYRSKAVVPVLVLLFVALWFILRGDLLYVFPCVILFLCFQSF